MRQTVATRQAGLDPRAWRIAAALAASLVVGVLTGASTVGEPAVTALIEVAGLSETDDLAWDEFDLYPTSQLEEQL